VEGLETRPSELVERERASREVIREKEEADVGVGESGADDGVCILH
jgi:hypothetical protein